MGRGETKATSEQIVSAYKDTGSVWEAARRLGMCGQSVWERLRALGHAMPNRKWSAEEIEELKRQIDNRTLSEIAINLGRPYAGVACMASRLGIVTRHGNRLKRKIPRGSGLTKPLITALLRDLQEWGGSIRQFCRSRGLSLDVFAMAVQKHDAETWRFLAWQRGLEEKTCPECGTGFYPMTEKQITCTRRCGDNHRRNKKYFGGRRQEAIGMREGICQLCVRAKASLSAHHMLGKENDEDNEHLIALCAGCHKLVTLAATRKILDTPDGWERFIELVMARRLADQGGEFMGTHVSVDVEYLTEADLIGLTA
jgi:uncharacterized CHY-type Zn-finger protein